MQKSGESLPLTIGRLVLLVDYNASRELKIYRHDQIDEIVKWDRWDLMYSEVLESAGLGYISGENFYIKLPEKWVNGHKHWAASKIRVENALRDDKGKFIAKHEKQKAVVCDAEGNEI